MNPSLRTRFETALVGLHALRLAVTTIGSGYFNDRPALFAATQANLDDAIRLMEEFAGGYNTSLVEERERYEHLVAPGAAPTSMSSHRVNLDATAG